MRPVPMDVVAVIGAREAARVGRLDESGRIEADDAVIIDTITNVISAPGEWRPGGRAPTAPGVTSSARKIPTGVRHATGAAVQDAP
jgi:hypothetical protein